MSKVLGLLDQDPRAIATPPEELRYIEGLFDLPLGFIDSFKVVPKAGDEKCICGRVPTALDIVHFAFAKQVHSRELIRDTLIGFANIFEFANNGRVAECYHCGKQLNMFSYFKKNYAYA